MHQQVAQVSVPKGRCMECPNEMDHHIILWQWQQQLHIIDPYHFVGGGEHNIPSPDIMSGNNTSHSNMWFDLTG